MDIGLINLSGYMDVFVLILIRVTALFIISPIFARKSVPNILKIGFAMLVALIIMPMMDMSTATKDRTVLQYALLVFNEFSIGVILGFVSYMAFSALYIAGQMIDMQIGFGIVSVIDPQSNIQIPVIANFYYIIAMLMFLNLNGHHILISSIFYSYKVLPIGTAMVSNILINDIVRMFSDMFIIGFKIAAPIVAATFVTNVALGILARTVPQMNIFIVGMPLKIAVGLATLMFVIPMFSIIMDVIVNGMSRDLKTVLEGMIIR
ncbi:MAG: flagellar biosynthesis protein FliR [Clostridiales bacterium]|nr:flagellar biosynthesis protein FliR [Clostridiales bacterium]